MRVSRAMLDVMASHGYARVSPAVAEFEASLSARSGGATRNSLLRFTDPLSGQTLALRGDITVQVGRIATTRMADAPRPLRLCYHGQVLRLRAKQLRPEREVTQLGAELVGNDSLAAASEIVGVALDALDAAGVKDITIDFTLPDLVETLAVAALPLAAEQIDAVRSELDMKDAGGLIALGAGAYLPLLAATGPFVDAVEKLRAIDAGGALASRMPGWRLSRKPSPDARRSRSIRPNGMGSSIRAGSASRCLPRVTRRRWDAAAPMPSCAPMARQR